ncbi:MAG: hypothetical protein EXS10_06280 [Phycisphaerales bacterium]|nr:hypothetical protein [Phycisphaerales bacterium]
MHAPDDANVPSAWVVLGGSTLGPWLGGEDVLHFLTQPPNGGPSAYWNDTGSLVNPCTGTLVTRSFIIEFSADCNNDGIVDAADLTFVLNNWGVCS